MFAAAGMTAFGGWGPFQYITTALALAAALVLDTADGRLARLQGTGSAFGRWLDQVLDELADLTLHAAIAWSVFRSTGQPGWLVLGTLYVSGKYMFVIQSLAGNTLEKQGTEQTSARRPARKSSILRRLVRLAGHADIRWHIWIVLALVGRLDLALVSYAVYFPLRAAGGGLRKAVVHA